MMPLPIVMDPELGPTRFCRRCDEWLPFDAEFWYIWNKGRARVSYVCRACQDRRTREWRERCLADPVKAERVRAQWRECKKRQRAA